MFFVGRMDGDSNQKVRSEVWNLPSSSQNHASGEKWDRMSPRRLTFQMEPFSTEMMTTGERKKERNTMINWVSSEKLVHQISSNFGVASHIVIECICQVGHVQWYSIRLQVFRNGLHWNSLHMVSWATMAKPEAPKQNLLWGKYPPEV